MTRATSLLILMARESANLNTFASSTSYPSHIFVTPTESVIIAIWSLSGRVSGAALKEAVDEIRRAASTNGNFPFTVSTMTLKMLACAAAHAGTVADMPRAQPASPPRLQLRPYPLYLVARLSALRVDLFGKPVPFLGERDPLRFVSRVCGCFPVLATHLGSAEELRCKVWHFRLRKTA
jgi:hypothetical protein